MNILERSIPQVVNIPQSIPSAATAGIVRAPHNLDNPYTCISDATINDNRLNGNPLTLLLRLLCKPDDWKIDTAALANEMDWCESKVKDALQTLRSLGYYDWTRSSNGKASWTWTKTVYESPSLNPGFSSDEISSDEKVPDRLSINIPSIELPNIGGGGLEGESERGRSRLVSEDAITENSSPGQNEDVQDCAAPEPTDAPGTAEARTGIERRVDDLVNDPVKHQMGMDLLSMGVTECKTLALLADFDITHIRNEYNAWIVDNHASMKNPVGVLIYRIRNNPPVQIDGYSEMMEADERPEHEQMTDEISAHLQLGTLPDQEGVEELIEEVAPLPVTPLLLGQPSESSQALMDLWPDVLSELQVSMPPARFDTWVSNLAIADSGDAAVTLIAPNAYAANWLKHRLGSQIGRKYSRVAGKTIVVEFVAAQSNGNRAPV